MSKCNLYLHWNPIKREIFYVGIGSIARSKCQIKRSDFYKSYVSKNNPEHTCVIFVKKNRSRVSCGITEQGIINWIGRRVNNTGTLTNFDSGGEHCVSSVFSEVSIQAIIEGAKKTHQGRKNTDEVKQKMSLSKSMKAKQTYVNNPLFNIIDLHSVWLLSKELGQSILSRNEKYEGWSYTSILIALDYKLPPHTIRNIVKRFRKGEDFGGNADLVRHNSQLYLDRLEAHKQIIEKKRKQAINDRTEPQKRIERTCPHCGLIGKGPNMSRYHFDNCKLK